MIRLRTLGALDLRAEDGTEAESVLRQPKRFALLVYLAVARPRGFQRRDRVLATFWPELDGARARGALNQSVFTLRQALGQNVVVNRGAEEIGIGPDALWCDAVAFDEAIERGDLEEALALYQGELLAGFHVDEAADFERWLDDERSHRSQRAAEAAWSLAERAGNEGDIASARDWAARAISFGPWDERGLRRLMMLLDGAGDRAGAIAAFQDFARRLRADLEVDPSAETLELVETIKARAEPNGGPEPAPLVAAQPVLSGDRARAAAEWHPAPIETPPDAPVGIAAQSGMLGRVRWTTVLLVVIVAALLVFIAMPPADPALRVAVLPVRDESPGQQYTHITGALTSGIIQLMHHPGSLNVVSEFGMRAYEDAKPTYDDVARRFDVGYIVSGVLTGSGERIKVTLELIDAHTGERIDGVVKEKAGSDWLVFSEQMGEELASLLRSRLGEVRLATEWRAGTSWQEAWEAVAKADELLRLARGRDYPQALKVLDKVDSFAEIAKRRDPAWSEPYAMLARSMERRAFLSAIYPGIPPVHAERMFDAAEAYAEQALARDSEKASSLELRGTIRHRRFVALTPPGTGVDSLLDAAEQDLREALRIDPFRARAANTLSQILYGRGFLDEARIYAEQALANDAFLEEIPNIVNQLFTIAFHQGDDDEAASRCDEVGRLMPDQVPHSICKLTLLSWSELAPKSAKQTYVELAGFGSASSPEIRAMYEPCALVIAAPAVKRDPAFGVDSAYALLHRAHALVEHLDSHPCLGEYEAAALSAMGDHMRARALVEKLLRRHPASEPRLRASRFFASFAREIVSANGSGR